MEIREYKGKIIAILGEGDDPAEFAEKILALHKEKPREILISLEVTSFEDLLGRIESRDPLEFGNLQDIAEIVPRTDLRLDHYRGTSLTSKCRTWGIPKPGTIPKDPSKGRNGMPRSRRQR